MALTSGDLAMWSELKERGVIPPNPRVLEIGQANWYGDIAPPPGCEDPNPYVVARKFYRQMLNYSEITAFDYSGPDALCVDLNEPVMGLMQRDIVINTGTTEHVFDQRQVFETIHDACAVGGLMVHVVPWKGWIDHGFYNYQPNLFRALAQANQYQGIYSAKQGVIDQLLYLVFRKTSDLPFVLPLQGTYPSGF
jgi:hypothetical protein